MDRPTVPGVRKKNGRPLKYSAFFEKLLDDEVYSPATVFQAGLDVGLLSEESAESIAAIKTKIRHTLSRFVKSHDFPPEGDGQIAIFGQQRSLGWYGRRWKAAASVTPGQGES